MYHTLVKAAVAIVGLGLVPTVSALGINCRGNSECGFQPFQDLESIVNQINGLPDGIWFQNGQHIACAYGGPDTFCAFLQNSGGADSRNIKLLINDLRDHGCKGCGSVPLGFPNSNDVSQGELTVNFVSG